MSSENASPARTETSLTVACEIERDPMTKDPLRIKNFIDGQFVEPVEHHNDLFGCTVQLAARLCSQAKPEQILASSAVAELCVGKTLPFQEVGEVSLKGFDTPVRAHAVVWANE